MLDLKFHHVGLIVKDIEEAILHYKALFGEESVSEMYIVRSQGIKECFVRNGKDIYIGLVSPIDGSSVIYNLMKKGITYYHIGYEATNVDETIGKLEELNYKLISIFPSEAFSGKTCAFLYTPEGAIVELIER